MKTGWTRLMVALLALSSLNGCVGLLLGGAALGVGVAHDRRTTGAVMDDQTIEIKLYNALNQGLPPGNHISTTSYNGAVLLSGEAVSEAVKQQAEAIVRGIEPPVRQVYNELVIAPPSTLAQRSNDTLITTKVKAALVPIRTLPGFDPTRIKVVTERGVVYLMGLVRPEEANAAATAASQVGGVQQVVTLFEQLP